MDSKSDDDEFWAESSEPAPELAMMYTFSAAVDPDPILTGDPSLELHPPQVPTVKPTPTAEGRGSVVAPAAKNLKATRTKQSSSFNSKAMNASGTSLGPTRGAAPAGLSVAQWRRLFRAAQAGDDGLQTIPPPPQWENTAVPLPVTELQRWREGVQQAMQSSPRAGSSLAGANVSNASDDADEVPRGKVSQFVTRRKRHQGTSTDDLFEDETWTSLAALEQRLAFELTSGMRSQPDGFLSIMHTIEDEYCKLEDQYLKRKALLDRYLELSVTLQGLSTASGDIEGPAFDAAFDPFRPQTSPITAQQPPPHVSLQHSAPMDPHQHTWSAGQMLPHVLECSTSPPTAEGRDDDVHFDDSTEMVAAPEWSSFKVAEDSSLQTSGVLNAGMLQRMIQENLSAGLQCASSLKNGLATSERLPQTFVDPKNMDSQSSPPRSHAPRTPITTTSPARITASILLHARRTAQ